MLGSAIIHKLVVTIGCLSLVPTSLLCLKIFASQSARTAGTQFASFSTSKITKNYPQNRPKSFSFHRNSLQIPPKQNIKQKSRPIPIEKTTKKHTKKMLIQKVIPNSGRPPVTKRHRLRPGSCCRWAVGYLRCRTDPRHRGRPGIPGPPGSATTGLVGKSWRTTGEKGGRDGV